jgi:hypothetical protein
MYMTSAAWVTPLTQPDTWVIVGHTVSSTLYEVAMESNDMTTGQNISRTAANELEIATTAVLTTSTTGSRSWNQPSVLLAEYNSTQSKIYFNNFTSPDVTGNAGSGASSGQGSLTIGSSDHAWGIGNYWDGTIAEIIGYSGLLSATAKAQLRQYVSGRYGITVI